MFICIAFVSLKYLWDMQKQRLMHSSTSHTAPHGFPYVSRKVGFMDREPVWRSGTIGPSTRRFAVDFTSYEKFWTNYTHLMCRNFICQTSVIAETRVKQCALAFKSCWFVRHLDIPASLHWSPLFLEQLARHRRNTSSVSHTRLASCMKGCSPTGRVIGAVNGSRRFRDRLTLHKLT